MGLDPVPVPGHVFSIDGERLRYGRFGRDGGELEVREYHSEELGEGTFLEGPLGGPVRDSDRFSHSLDGLMSRLSEVPEAASLVVPDKWLRVVFTDLEKLPRGTNREDILRFKLKRLVPFRVEDLRVSAVATPALEGSNRTERLILGFGIETLLRQLEDGLGRHGVVVGSLSNEGLGVLPALAPMLRGGLGGVVHVSRTSYSLIVTLDGRPVLHRFKSLEVDPEARSRFVPRDLGLTYSYLRKEIKGRRLGELVLVASTEEEPSWKDWLEQAFEHQVRSLNEELPELPGAVSGVPTWDALPLLGAASRGVC